MLILTSGLTASRWYPALSYGSNYGLDWYGVHPVHNAAIERIRFCRMSCLSRDRRVYAFDDAKTALADLVKGQHVGKLVIRVS